MNAHAQYVFQAEGSLKDGEENAPTQHALLRWEPGVQTVAVKCDLCDFFQKVRPAFALARIRRYG